MVGRLCPDVVDDGAELSDPDGSRVITRCPLKRASVSVAVTIRNAGARALQALHECGQVKHRLNLKDHVDVVVHHADRQHVHIVLSGFGAKKTLKECFYSPVDQREAVESRPRDVDVKARTHRANLCRGGSSDVIRKMRRRSLHCPELRPCSPLGRNCAESGPSARGKRRRGPAQSRQVLDSIPSTIRSIPRGKRWVLMLNRITQPAPSLSLAMLHRVRPEGRRWLWLRRQVRLSGRGRHLPAR